MARLPALISTYARLDGRDYSTIKNIARTIREAGLLPTTKRGWGASAMSERDAVNLVLGANGAETAGGAEKAIMRLRGFVATGVYVFERRPGSSADDDEFFGDDPALEWVRVPKDSSKLSGNIWAPLAKIDRFGDACDWLMENAISLDSEIREIERARALRMLDRLGSQPAEDRRTDAEIVASGLPWIQIQLTIERSDASFIARPVSGRGFPSLSISYREPRAPGESPRYLPRRAIVEIDFSLFYELAVLVASKVSPKLETAEA